MEWHETGILGAICYQIATKKNKWVKGLRRGGLSLLFGLSERREEQEAGRVAYLHLRSDARFVTQCCEGQAVLVARAGVLNLRAGLLQLGLA